jgi:hypothetical protein
MHNQHAGLSQVLAEQRMTERWEQAAHARLAGGARWLRRRRRRWVVRGWWQLTRWPVVATDQPVQRPYSASYRSEGTMSKRARALILGATLAAMNLAGLTAVAHAQANHDPDGKDARRPPTEAQVGEAWRHRQVPSPRQTTADAALRRQLARERFSIPNGTPAQAPTPTQADEPNGQPGWLLASLGGLAAALALIAGLVVLAIRRAGRRARVGHAA